MVSDVSSCFFSFTLGLKGSCTSTQEIWAGILQWAAGLTGERYSQKEPTWPFCLISTSHLVWTPLEQGNICRVVVSPPAKAGGHLCPSRPAVLCWGWGARGMCGRVSLWPLRALSITGLTAEKLWKEVWVPTLLSFLCWLGLVFIWFWLVLYFLCQCCISWKVNPGDPKEKLSWSPDVSGWTQVHSTNDFSVEILDHCWSKVFSLLFGRWERADLFFPSSHFFFPYPSVVIKKWVFVREDRIALEAVISWVSFPDAFEKKEVSICRHPACWTPIQCIWRIWNFGKALMLLGLS